MGYGLGQTTTQTVTIANNASLSGACKLGSHTLCGLVLPSAWTAAGIAFHVSYDDGTTYVQLNKPDTTTNPMGLDEVEILAADVPAAESIYIALDPLLFVGCTDVKVRSQTAGSAVNQGAARSVICVLRQFA